MAGFVLHPVSEWHPRMSWNTHTVAAGELDVWTPEHLTTEGVILFLHDWDAVTPHQRDDWRTIVEASPLTVVCPRAGRTWWLPVPVPGYDEGPLHWVSHHVVSWIESTLGVRPPRVAVIGIGMGGGGALNLAFRHARRIPVVVGISAAIDFHEAYDVDPVLQNVFTNREAARQQTATLHLHPLNWPLSMRIVCDPADPLWLDGCERLASKLYSSSIPHEYDFTTTTGGDRAAYDRMQLKNAIEFVVRKLPEAARQLEVVTGL